MDSAEDDEERQAYEDLVNVIGDVRKVREQLEQEKLAAAAAKEEAKRLREEEIANSLLENDKAGQSMSTAEVLKAAQKIEEGVMTASKEALEEEGSDFMTDAKATVGLAGFNNQGRMRVGGS